MKVLTDHPLAEWSPDHIHPKGTATDSTTHQGFNDKLFRMIPNVHLLDLGCAGGGLVRSILDDGGFAIGIDGSDYSAKRYRAEWGTIPGYLFTADITHPFTVTEDYGEPLAFDVVTAWEVLEHIPEPLIETIMKNVGAHLTLDGMFICSISQSEDHWEDHDYHVTVKERGWWTEKMAELGWYERPDLNDYFHPDWVRGPENGMNSFAMVVTR